MRCYMSFKNYLSSFICLDFFIPTACTTELAESEMKRTKRNTDVRSVRSGDIFVASEWRTNNEHINTDSSEVDSRRILAIHRTCVGQSHLTYAHIHNLILDLDGRRRSIWSFFENKSTV